MPEDNRPTVVLLNWFEKLRKNKKASPPSSVRQSQIPTQPYEEVSPALSIDQQIKNTFYEGNEIKPEFRLGIELWQQLINIDPGFMGDRNRLTISMMLISHPYDSPMLLSERLVNWNRMSQLPAPQRAHITKSAHDFLLAIKPLQDKERGRILAHELQNGFLKSDIRAPLVQEVNSLDYQCTEKMVGADIFAYHIPSVLTPELKQKVNRAISKVETSWQRLRQSTDRQFITIFFSPHSNAIVRSQAYMKHDPVMLLAIDEPDNQLDMVAIHETIHIVFGAETGWPGSTDFAEGVANRLAVALGADQMTVYRSMKHLIPLIQQMAGHSPNMSSSTMAVEEMKRQNYGWDEVKVAEQQLTYIWGYFLIDALLSNQKYLSMNEEWRNAGKGEFGLMLYINQCYAEEYKSIQIAQGGLEVKQRVLLARVLINHLKFTVQEFDELRSQINQKIVNAARLTRDLIPPQA